MYAGVGGGGVGAFHRTAQTSGEFVNTKQMNACADV